MATFSITIDSAVNQTLAVTSGTSPQTYTVPSGKYLQCSIFANGTFGTGGTIVIDVDGVETCNITEGGQFSNVSIIGAGSTLSATPTAFGTPAGALVTGAFAVAPITLTIGPGSVIRGQVAGAGTSLNVKIIGTLFNG